MAASDPRDNHGLFEKLSSQGDVDGLLGLYEEDAVYVASADNLLRGREQIRTALQMMIDLGIETRLELIELVETGDVALEKTRWTSRIPAQDGTTTESTGLSTVVLRRQPDGQWLMAIDDPGLS